MLNLHQQINANKRNTYIIITCFILFVSGLIYVFSKSLGYGYEFMVPGIIFASISSLTSYYFSDRIVLGMSGAKEASRDEFFDFYTVAENVSRVANIPMPKLYVINDTSMNAFATGRDPKNGVVVATTGILERLERSELEGVIAHEIAHIKNYDIRTMAMVSVLVGIVTLIADWFLRLSFYSRSKDSDRDNNASKFVFLILGIILTLVSPIVASLIKLAVSRTREYLADATAVKFTKNPEGLARALEKLSQDTEPLEAANKATAHLFIVNPLLNLQKFGGGVGLFANLFSTHPPIEERINKLRSIRG